MGLPGFTHTLSDTKCAKTMRLWEVVRRDRRGKGKAYLKTNFNVS